MALGVVVDDRTFASVGRVITTTLLVTDATIELVINSGGVGEFNLHSSVHISQESWLH